MRLILYWSSFFFPFSSPSSSFLLFSRPSLSILSQLFCYFFFLHLFPYNFSYFYFSVFLSTLPSSSLAIFSRAPFLFVIPFFSLRSLVLPLYFPTAFSFLFFFSLPCYYYSLRLSSTPHPRQPSFLPFTNKLLGNTTHWGFFSALPNFDKKKPHFQIIRHPFHCFLFIIPLKYSEPIRDVNDLLYLKDFISEHSPKNMMPTRRNHC